jgi:FkbM family methyltransferase
MGLSKVAIRAADAAPFAARPFVKLWAYWYSRRPDAQHWLFRELRSRLRVTVHREVILPTGQRIMIDPFDSDGRAVLLHGCLEPETVALLSALLSEGMTYVDVGANIGHHALIAASRVGERGAIHAFEPAPAMFEALRRNMRRNGCRNVSCNNCALGDQQGVAQFYLSDISHSCANSLARTVHVTDRQVSISVRTLDDYAVAAAINRLDVLKVDVEGAELMVLRGAERTISQFQPLIVLEFSKHTIAFGYEAAELAQTLRNLEYELFTVGTMPLTLHSHSDELFYNVLAVPVNRLTELGAKQIVRFH